MIGKKWTVRQFGTLLRLNNAEAVELLRAALRETEGNVVQAARNLGFPRPYTLLEWFYEIPSLRKIPRQSLDEARVGNVAVARETLEKNRRKKKRSKK